MAKCPSCRLLVSHGANSCTCGSPLVLVRHPHQIASLVAFTLFNFAVTYFLSRAVFALLLSR
ncbi:MAG: hypothetical protein P4L40_19230 [Terracidiphilus sp.]|nr:hypothetical protein [Terracidiphilus sp.]